VREAGLLFVHIPKAAGMSISEALYGAQIKHASIRLHRHLDRALRDMPSFAVMRDPADRFLSAYRYGRAGGSANNDVAEPFRTRYMAFRSIDEALDHVETASSPYAVDHIFRAQSWYVTDDKGRVAVDRLVAIDDLDQLPSLVPGFPACSLPALNRSQPIEVPRLNAAQHARLRVIYADDYALWENVARRIAAPQRAEQGRAIAASTATLEIAI